jgi:hypothetical protein
MLWAALISVNGQLSEVSTMSALSLCAGLVALLIFLVLNCVVAKKANVPTNAWSFVAQNYLQLSGGLL